MTRFSELRAALAATYGDNADFRALAHLRVVAEESAIDLLAELDRLTAENERLRDAINRLEARE